MNQRQWLAEQAAAIRASGDEDRMRMMACYVEAYDARERDPDRAVAAFVEGRQLAERLAEPWWVLFYEKERVDALIHFKRDYRQVLDLAMHCVLEVRKPANAQYPGRLGVWDSLVAAYLGIDAEGYAGPIQEALEYLDREVPQEPDSNRYLLLARQRVFSLENDRLDEAYDTAMRELHLAASDRDQSRAVHFATFTYCALCQVAGAIERWDTVGEWAGVAEELAREKGHQCELSEALAWQAVAAQQAGDEDRARRALHTATTTMGRLQMPPKRGYFDALALYHEHNEDLEGALAVRDAELRSIANRGRLLYECQVQLRRCVLLARLGRLQAGDLETAREAARTLQDPDKYLKQIDRLAEGTGFIPGGTSPES